jgi:outer membrane protein
MNGTLVLHPRLTAALACLVLAFVALTPASLAADVADVGFIDQAALSNLAPFANANRKLTAIKADLDRQFQARLRGVKSANDQARIAQEFQNKFGARQRELLGPLFQRAQIAIASVASSKNLSVVVDKRIIIFGGTDVTHDVIDLFSGVGDPVPPSSTPPPSSVGYVDEQQINAVPKIKKANDDFAKIQDDQRNAAQAKMRGAKSDADRQQIFKDLQKTLLEKHKEIVDPVVDQTRNAIADVARRKGLALVIDRGDLIYGGTDITTDVTNALK